MSAKLTEEDRAFLRRQANQLSTSVEDLMKTIAAHPNDRVDHFLDAFHALWAALGATAVIAAHAINDEIKARLKAGDAAYARSHKTRDQEINKKDCRTGSHGWSPQFIEKRDCETHPESHEYVADQKLHHDNIYAIVVDSLEPNMAGAPVRLRRGDQHCRQKQWCQLFPTTSIGYLEKHPL